MAFARLLRSLLLVLSILTAPSMLAQQAADLFVTKNGPFEAAAGSDVAYDVTVLNAGPDDAAGVTLDDALPAGMTFVSATQNLGPAFNCATPAVGDPGNVTCTIATLTVDSTATFTFVFHIPAGTPEGTTFTNFANVSSQAFDPNDENNVAAAATTVPFPAQADVGVQKVTSNAAGADSDLTFTITITNSGPGDATNLSLTDTLPGDLTFVSLAQSGESLSCTTPAIGGGGTVTCSAATYPAGASTTLTLVTHVPSGTAPGTTYTNTASVKSDHDPAEENNSATISVTVTAVDLSVTKTGPATATAGEPIAYTITVLNGSLYPAEQVRLTDVLPPATTFVSIETTSPATCVDSAVVVECTIDLLAPNASADFTLTLIAGNTTSITNTASVDTASFDTNAANDSDDAITAITPSADLSVTKSGPAVVTAGANVTYTVDVMNRGPSDAASVTLTDTLPANTTLVSFAQTGGPAFNCAGTTCTIALFAPGLSASFELVVTVASSATGSLTNTADISSVTADPVSANNVATSTATLIASADLSITKSSPATATPGENVTYTIGVSNAGPSDAASVSVTDTLPANTTPVSFTQTAGPSFNCAATTCTIASFVSGASASFELVVSVASSAAGSLTNTSAVSTSTNDPNNLNDSATSVATLSASADLSVVKTGPPTATAGQTITYAIAVANAGPSDASSVTLSDTMPTGTTFASFTQTSGPTFSCTTGATVTCTIATFADGASASFELVVDVAPSTTTAVSNTATVASASADPNGANNSSTTSTGADTDADLSITKSGPNTALPNTDLQYTITVTNAGPSNAANVVLTDVLPSNTTFVSLEQTSGPLFSCSTGATVTCTIASLGVTNATFALVVHVAPDAQGEVSNTATIASTTNDQTPANGAATAAIAIETADLSITKSVSTPTAAIRERVTYTIVVTNQGPDTATGVTVTDTLPDGATLESATASQGTCSGSTVITCSLGTLAAGASATITLEVSMPYQQGTATNTATVSAAQADPAGGNNTSSAAVTVALGAATGIPTLSPWMLAVLAASLALIALLRK